MPSTPASPRATTARTAITIGNFDAVHVGHATLLSAARLAVGEQGRVVVLSFDPNPLTVLKPDAVPPRLTTFAQRERLLRTLGATDVVRIAPTRDFLQQSPEQFLAWCVERWHPEAIVEGVDFRFGRGRAGSVATLRELEGRFGYRTVVVDPVDVALTDQTLVGASSTLARWLIAHGRVRDAAIVLGRPYEVEAAIVAGDKRGRTIGFPTANLAATDQMLPGDGIYAGIAWRDEDDPRPAAVSVGTKPTFGASPRTCEAFLLDYDGPVEDYGWNIRLQFTHWLRDQLTFANAQALIEQLHHDVAQVRAIATQSPWMAIGRLSGAHAT